MTTALLAVLALAAACTSGGHKPATVVTVPIAGRPSALTVAGGMVWVADDQGGVVVTVDAAKGRAVGAPIKVGPSPIALAASSTTVWVGDATGTLTRLDVARREAVGQPIEVGGVVSGIAVDGSAVWVVDNEHGTLIRVDAATGDVGPPATFTSGAVRVAADRGAVWVTNGENTVTPVGGAPVTVGTGPIGLAVRNGVVWVTNSEDDTVSRIVSGPASGPVPATVVGKAPVAVVAGADGAWVVSQDVRQLTRLDPSTGKVARTTSISTRPRGISLGSDRVWIAGVEPSAVIGVLRSALGGA